jgi:hypothetical protein
MIGMVYKYVTTRELKGEFKIWNKMRRDVGLARSEYSEFLRKYKELHPDTRFPAGTLR